MDRFTTKENPKAELIGCVYCMEHSNCYSNMSCDEIYNALSKLRYYEDLEEQERLIVLPCKFGTPVYFIAFDNCLNGKCCWFKNNRCDKETRPEYCPKEVFETTYSLEMYQRGTRVFLTRKEAEVALNNI